MHITLDKKYVTFHICTSFPGQVFHAGCKLPMLAAECKHPDIINKQSIHRHKTLPRFHNAATCAILHDTKSMLGHMAQYGQTWYNPWNRKYTTYCNSTRRGPSHGHRRSNGSGDLLAVRETYRQMHRQTNRIQYHSLPGSGVINSDTSVPCRKLAMLCTINVLQLVLMCTNNTVEHAGFSSCTHRHASYAAVTFPMSLDCTKTSIIKTCFVVVKFTTYSE